MVTTQSFHYYRVHDNKLTGFKPTAVDQAWVCDITYVRIKSGFVYLFLVTDLYSRKIVGWNLNTSLGMEGAMKAAKQAIQQSKNCTGLIHHSDRGIQYCATEYVAQLKKHGIKISMAEAGNCYENAVAERLNGILKSEYALEETFADYAQAKQATTEAIKLYNEDRPHWSLNLQTPAKVHAA